jgi:elongator complex protein 3
MTISERQKRWKQDNTLTPEKIALARLVLADVRTGKTVLDALRAYPQTGGGVLSKAALVAAYNEMTASGELAADKALLEKIRMKPVRTLSGVTTVTVLTKPYPCPGKCIFCPTDVRMPKSYLPDEPGAMRALEHNFDPFTQVQSRIIALQSLGHPTDKIELLILGGTWSAYRRDYQEWFIKRCFDAMNETNPMEAPAEGLIEALDAGELAAAQALNENAAHRNVGLVIETRPDEITPTELAWLRYLGVTKVQMGAQSLDDRVLEMNKRGHDAATTRNAVALLRAAGFKIVLHWMPNLYGATPEGDREDFSRLWKDVCPDEIKIYPNQLLANAELYQVWQRGDYTPYTTQQLIDLIADVKPGIPRYCRVNRVIRDIPSNNVVAGNRRTSLRMDVQAELKRRGTKCSCLRCREVRGSNVISADLKLDDLVYPVGAAEEHFLSYVTPDDQIAGFLRLCLPAQTGADASIFALTGSGLSDLAGAALIREVHVYGQSLAVGSETSGAAQHSGLGTKLLSEAEIIALAHGYNKIAVISAVGTRKYYLDRGYERGALYLTRRLTPGN